MGHLFLLGISLCVLSELIPSLTRGREPPTKKNMTHK